MEANQSSEASLSSSQNPLKPTPRISKNRDVLLHLEDYLAKSDGLDKLLKISRYTTKVILASSLLPEKQPLTDRLKSFEWSVGVSRKVFRLGKFIQDLNALRSFGFTSHQDLIFSVLANVGKGLYCLVEQFVWLGNAGLIDKKHLSSLQNISAWCEFLGYIVRASLTVQELRRIGEDELVLSALVAVSMLNGTGYGEAEEKLGKLREKKLMKRLSVVQDMADGLVALADIRKGKGRLSAPLLVSSAGLFSASISTHKNWVSCGIHHTGK